MSKNYFRDNDLRARGYPSSSEGLSQQHHNYKTIHIEPKRRHAIMKDDIPMEFYQKMPKEYSEFHDYKMGDRKTLKDIVKGYNKVAPYIPNSPIINSFDEPYSDPLRPERANYGVVFSSNDGDTKGFVRKTVDNKQTDYSAAINGLASILGDEEFYKTYDTPFGNASAAYNGNVLYGNFNVPVNKYYLNALKTLLNRGNL